MTLRRSPSQGYGFEPNKNTDWLEDRYFYIWYALTIFLALILFGLTNFYFNFPPDGYIWTLIHIIHALTTFLTFHWWKGTPFQLTEDQGRFDEDTFWEQIDHGRQGTFNRRMLTTIPVILFLLASYENHWHTIVTIINVGFLFLVLIPKLDVMDHVRIAGINKGD